MARQPMRIQARKGSLAEKRYFYKSSLPGYAWAMPKAIADGIDPSPLDDLMFHGGRVIPQMEYENIKKTPLWYYILKEAEVRGGGEHLGPVGSRSVAEVFVGLLSRGTNSLLAKENKNFKPSLGPTPGQFTMANLLEFVGELNPVG
jgi:hypothetical protein